VLNSGAFAVVATCGDHLDMRFQVREWEFISRDEALTLCVMGP
jgi:ribonucleotide reductase beta subunit family protein with ferritin-like domain